MKGFDRLHVKSAVKSRNQLDISRTHLTTGEFGQIQPLLCEETIPGDKFNVGASYFSRMAPLAKPTYGKFSFRTLTGFVPYYQIADDAEAFIDGKTTWEGSTPTLRFFTMSTYVNFLLNYCSATGTATSYDWAYTNSSGTLAYRKWSAVGRYWVKVLNALGYAVPESVDMQTTSTWYVNVGSMKLNAMPLLAFFKLYNDWMSQSQRYNTSALTEFLKNIKHGVTVSSYFAMSTGISYLGLSRLFDNLKLCYENDYFTSAWQNPNVALNTGEYVNLLKVPSNVAGSGNISFDANETYVENPIVNVGGADYSFIGQRALDFLRSFDNWVKRNNYSGSRVVQNVFSRFGIKTSDYRDNYAEVITTDVSPIQVGDVTSQSDATGAVLGDYAGKGIMSDGKRVSYQASDYGMFFILGWFTVTPMYPFGFSKHVLRTQPLDYYTPEFDGLGAEAISLAELYEDPTVVTSDVSRSTNVFGFTERYNSYRYGRDQITGDFRDFRNIGMNVWHTGRYLTNPRTAGTLVAQSLAMNTLPVANSEFNRIFNVITSTDVDHFYLTCQFDFSAVRPMLNLNQVPGLGEGNTSVPRNGNEVN